MGTREQGAGRARGRGGSGADEHIKETAQLPTSELRASSSKERHQGIVLHVYHREGISEIPLRSSQAVVVGRAPGSEQGGAINDPSLSRAHARFKLIGDTVAVEDLDSRNGTWFRGVRISSAPLAPGDEVLLSDVRVVVHADATPRPLARLLSHERFRVALEDEIVRARYFGRSFSLIMVRQEGSDGSHVSGLYERVAAHLRPVDRAAFYSPDTVELILPETPLPEANKIADGVTARTDAGPALVAGVAAYPGAASDAEALLAECRRALLQGKRTERVRTAATGARVSASGARDASDGSDMVVASAVLREALKLADRAARSTIPVLILGETGTGKEVLARRVHDAGPRREGPFVVLNCAAIPENLVEATLFGHERGAFTGADRRQKGMFELAHRGTLMLDEIGDLPKLAQAKLLRVLETSKVRKVGGEKEIDVDVRVIAATHCDLQRMTEEKAFREDLLYRLNAIAIAVPPLRERVEDIDPLIECFLQRANKQNHCAIKVIDPKARDLLRRYAWPGNVRELRNAIDRAVVLAEEDSISVDDLPERVRGTHGERSAAGSIKPAAGPAADEGKGLRERLTTYEAQQIVEALNAVGGNQKLAAERLDLPLRTLVHKLKQLNIARPYQASKPVRACKPRR